MSHFLKFVTLSYKHLIAVKNPNKLLKKTFKVTWENRQNISLYKILSSKPFFM